MVRALKPLPGGSAVWDQHRGLTSWGELGSVLGMILADSVNGKVHWSHWEQTSLGLAAVFHYSVPKTASHFEVVSSIQRQAAMEAFAGPSTKGSRVAGIQARPSDNPSANSLAHEKRGYGGIPLARSRYRNHPPHHHRS